MSVGGRAWLLMVTAIAAYEVWAPDGELLSEAVDRGLEKHPLLIHAAIAVTALHLLNRVPEWCDPYARLAKWGRR